MPTWPSEPGQPPPPRTAWINGKPVRAYPSFACHHCWRLKYDTLATDQGWNDFIHYISDGVLFGSEVKRPDIGKPRRKRAYTKRRSNGAPRRQRALEELLSDLTFVEIAARMQISVGGVAQHAKHLYREHGVHSRQQLAPQARPARAAQALTQGQPPPRTGKGDDGAGDEA